MPMYDYVCEDCPHEFTVRQGYHDPRVATCPTCGGKGKQRISMPAVVFKGSGFYVNDYGGRKTGQPPAKDSGDAGGDSGGGGDDHDHSSNGASEHSHPHPHPHPH
ncbi:MAG: FmdB family transcriptional regulator [Dehalococcoidia bacterium]|nr:FmdB family transcriptional regulator [Dehalococcoidia bacterium]